MWHGGARGGSSHRTPGQGIHSSISNKIERIKSLFGKKGTLIPIRIRVGKDVAIWTNAVDELRNNQLLIPVENRGEIFQLTKFGYEVLERI